MSESTIQVGRRKLKVSNLQKVLYPRAGFTKGQVIGYYLDIADAILPHLKGRPLTLKRYPDGVTKHFFYEKNCPAYRPEWVDTLNRPSDRRSGGVDYCVVDNRAALVWVANLAALELHVLLSKGSRKDRPTHMVFDLDPGEGRTLLHCIDVAFTLRGMLEHFGLQSAAKTSGGKGLHLYVPLNTAVTFEQTKAFAKALASLAAKENPKTITTVMRKDLRKGKVFVDWSQNDEHKTTVCVYSLRARETPTVSMPVTWDELEAARKSKKGSQLVFAPDEALQRVAQHGDLFTPVLKLKQKLPELSED